MACNNLFRKVFPFAIRRRSLGSARAYSLTHSDALGSDQSATSPAASGSEISRSGQGYHTHIMSIYLDTIRLLLQRDRSHSIHDCPFRWAIISSSVRDLKRIYMCHDEARALSSVAISRYEMAKKLLEWSGDPLPSAAVPAVREMCVPQQHVREHFDDLKWEKFPKPEIISEDD